MPNAARRGILKSTLGVLSVSSLCRQAAATDFPQRPLRLVVPYAPGGATDLMARLLQEPLSRALGQRVIAENKPGAAGAIGTRDAARSAPDGYTLLLGNNGLHTVLPVLSSSAGYDGIKEFVPVASVGTTPLLLIANSALPVESVAGLIGYARERQRRLAYASSGVGSMSHLATEQFLSSARIEGVHVPYKGQAPTLNAILGDEVQFAIVSPSPMLSELVAQGRIRMLGVSTPAESPIAPGVPPLSTAVPGYEVEVWFCLLAPAATPGPVLDKLRRSADSVLKEAQVQAGLRRIGAVPGGRSPERLRDAMAAEKDMWAAVIREKGIRAE